MSPSLRISVFLFVLFLSGCSMQTEDPRTKDVDQRLSRLVQVPMIFDASGMSPREKEFLKSLVDAAQLLHEAYLNQICPEGIPLRDSLAGVDDPLAKKLHRLVVRNGGPFDKMDHFTDFVGGFQKTPGGAFYPRDMTKEMFERHIAEHPLDAAAFQSSYTVIRNEQGALTAVPYHRAFGQWIEPASGLLAKAATLTDNPSLAKFLESRSHALMTDDYYESDCDWIDLKDHDIDLVFGPYEVYEDGLMNLKATYEATIGIRDKEESAKLEVYTRHLDDLEQQLPHDNMYKRSIKGLASPMVIVTDVIRAGDIATGYQPVAANLPNDPRVQTTKGTKKTFWKNVMKARVEKIIEPVGREVIASDQIEYITPEGVFNFVLMHELCHALGPQYVYGTGDSVSISSGLKDHYSAIEEGKADLAGLHSIKYFIDNGIIPRSMERVHYVSYLASLFRTIRFGTTEAHGKAAICELNFLWDRQGIRLDSVTKKWSVNFERIGPALSEMAKILLELEARGDYEGATAFFAKWGGTPREIASSLENLTHVPVDVEPVYSIIWD